MPPKEAQNSPSRGPQSQKPTKSRFESSCSFLHKPSKADTILEEVKKLEKDIAELKSHNSVVQKMLQYFNLFEKELKTLKEMMHNANSNIDAKNEKNTEKKETIENKKNCI